MISIEQIKAARALLNWTQDDLAFKAGLSKPMINTLERRLANPRADSMASIQRSLEHAGVEFTESDGVRRRTNRLLHTVFEGNDALWRLYRDIFDTLSISGGELLISGQTEDFYRFAGGAPVLEEIERRSQRGISTKILMREGDGQPVEPTAQHRCLPPAFSPSVPTYVYDNKYALFLWGPPQKVVLIENAEIADSYRQQFLSLWEVAQPPAV